MRPKLTRVAILTDADIPGTDASGLAPIDRTNAAAARAAGLALVVLEVPAVFAIAKTVAALATARRIPTLLWGVKDEEAGAVMSCGTSLTATDPRAPVFVDKILKGAKPTDTPIEFFSKHRLVINLKTAREVGLNIPAELLKRADRVVE